MKRRLFNLVASMSLILAVAVGVLWVRSYWWYGSISRDCEGTTRALVWFVGHVGYARHPGYEDRPATWRYEEFQAYLSIPGHAQWTWGERLGFIRWDLPTDPRDLLVTIPHWLVILPLLIVPAWWTRGWMKRRACHALGFPVVSAEASSMIQ